MKKVLLTSLGVMVALAMVLTACQDPTDFTNTNYEGKVINTLETPQNVTAWAYAPTGYIRVTWDPVPNASGYEIYRRTELNGKATVKFLVKVDNAYSNARADTDFYYEDIIDFDNEDITGNVTYKVVAYSDWSSNPKTASNLPWDGNDNDWFLLQNSSAESNRVSLSGAPAPGSAIAKPTNLKVSKVTTYTDATLTPSSVVQLTWDAVPGVDYFINYGVGGGELDKAPLSTWTQAVATTLYQKTGAAIIPLLGKTSIELVAQHQSTTSAVYGAAKYYGASEPATASEEGPAPATFGAPTGLSATPLTSKFVQLKWKAAQGATGYKVYRFIASAASYFGVGGEGVVYEAWKEVTGLNIINDDGFDNLSAIDNLTTLYDGDNGINNYPQKNLIYVVIATGPNNTVSVPSNVAYAGPNQVSAQVLSATNLWNANTNPYTLTDGWPGIRLNWSTQAYSGLSHKLYRAEVVYDGAAIISEGDYAEIASENDGFNTVADSDAQHNYGFIDTGAAVRKSWRYRLDTIAADGTVINSYYQTVTTYPYRDEVTINVTAVTNLPTLDPYNSSTPVTTRRAAYITGYQIANSVTQAAEIRSLLLDGEEVKVYRVQVATSNVNGAILGEYEELTPISKESVSNKVYEEYPGKPGYWKYFALVETTAMKNAGSASVQQTLTTADTAVWDIEDGTAANSKIVTVNGNGLDDKLSTLQVIAVITTVSVSGADATQAIADSTLANLNATIGGRNTREAPLQLSRNTTGNPNSNEYRTGNLGLQVQSGQTYYAHEVSIFYINGAGVRTAVAGLQNVTFPN